MSQSDVDSVVDLQISDCHRQIAHPAASGWDLTLRGFPAFPRQGADELALLGKASTASAACLFFMGNSFELHDPVFKDQSI